MKTPTIFMGTSKALNNAIGNNSKITFPSQFWTTDTQQYGYLTQDGQLRMVGVPKLNGTLDNPIVVSELESGIYSITGQHKIDRTEKTIYLSAVPVIYQVSVNDTKTKIKRITASNITDIVIENGEIQKDAYITDNWLRDNGYIPEGDIDTKIAALKVSLEQEISEAVGNVFDEKIDNALEERIFDVGEANIKKLFE